MVPAVGQTTLCIATDTAVLVYVFDMAIIEALKLATKMEGYSNPHIKRCREGYAWYYRPKNNYLFGPNVHTSVCCK